MEIEVKDLMADNEMLSHIFLGCIDKSDLKEIKNKYIGTKDWRIESVKLPVEMSIGGVPVNPKKFFDTWRDQMKGLIEREAKKLFQEKAASKKMCELADMLGNYEEILRSWESDINWEAENPLIDKKDLKL
jgi:hypothetical protein